MKKRALFTAAIALASLAAAMTPAGAATPAAATTVYNATTTLGNTPSVGAEAYAYKEFGDAVTFGGAATTLGKVTVQMSSWACEAGTWNGNNCSSTAGDTYKMPITLSIYSAPQSGDNGTVVPGDLITRVSKQFKLPYRPSANVKHCNTTNNSLGKWYDKADNACYNGLLTNITYDFTSLALDLPSSAVISVSYDTTHYGYHPIGESAACFATTAGCFYDSLNVGLDTSAPTAGAELDPGTLFQNSDLQGEYCDSTPQTGVFNQDSPTNSCWAGYELALKVTATGSAPQ